METELDRHISHFGIVTEAVKYITTGESYFDQKYFKKYSDRIGGLKGWQTQCVIKYLDEQLRFTQTDSREMYVKGVIKEFQDIENSLFCNWEHEVCVVNNDTRKANFEMFSRIAESDGICEVYLKKCLSLYYEFLVAFIELCKKFKIDLSKMLEEKGFIFAPDSSIAGEDEGNFLQFDINDTTNPLIFDSTLLINLHREFIDNDFLVPIDYNNFKNCFRKNPQLIEFKKGLSKTAICYIFGTIEHKNIGVKDFSQWMKNHIGQTNYRDKKSEFEKIATEASKKRNGFSLSAPQQKVLDLKLNIDNRIKLVLKNSI